MKSEVIRIPFLWFMSVQNKMAPIFTIILRGLTLILSRMLENLIAGSLGDTSNGIQNVTVI